MNEGKRTGSVNFGNVIKLIKFLKKRKADDLDKNKIDLSIIDYAKENNWTEERWRSYDNKTT